MCNKCYVALWKDGPHILHIAKPYGAMKYTNGTLFRQLHEPKLNMENERAEMTELTPEQISAHIETTRIRAEKIERSKRAQIRPRFGSRLYFAGDSLP